MADIEERKPNEIDVYVGGRIRARRKDLGVSQEKLGDELGLTFQQIQKYERASNRVSASKLFAIAQTLDTSVLSFFPRQKVEEVHETGLGDLMSDPVARKLIDTLVEIHRRTPETLGVILGAVRGIRDVLEDGRKDADGIE